MRAGVDPRTVWLQSFSLADVRYWLRNTPRFGRQAVFLDGRYENAGFDPAQPGRLRPSFGELFNEGLRIIAPPTWVLLAESRGKIEPSKYASAAKRAGLEIITWTFERSGAPPSGFYLQSFQGAVRRNGDVLKALHVLAKRVGILGIFTDWPATVTYYANCFRL